MVFVDCYTTWCGPCKMMTEEIFPKKEAGDFFNTHFVNVKFDMEKGEGKELAKQFKIRAYPTFILLNSEGKEMYRVVGGRRASRVYSSGEERITKGKYIRSTRERVQDWEDDEKTNVRLCIDFTRFL